MIIDSVDLNHYQKAFLEKALNGRSYHCEQMVERTEHRVIKVVSIDGQVYCLRTGNPTRRTRQHFAEEVELTKAAVAKGLHPPLVDVDITHRLMLVTYIEDDGVKIRGHHLYTAAEKLRELHNAFSVIALPKDDGGLGGAWRFIDDCTKITMTKKPAWLPDVYLDTMKRLEAIFNRMLPLCQKNRVWCHGDCSRFNAMFSHEKFFWIDFTDFIVDVPEYDFVKFCISARCTRSEMKRFYSGYKHNNVTEEDELMLDIAYLKVLGTVAANRYFLATKLEGQGVLSKEKLEAMLYSDKSSFMVENFTHTDAKALQRSATRALREILDLLPLFEEEVRE